VTVPIRYRVKATLLGTGLVGLAIAGLLAAALSAQAQPAPQSSPAPVKPPSPAVQAFDRFMSQSNPVCQKQSSHRCVDMGWRFADRDGDGLLTLQEVQAVRADMGDWLMWKGVSVPPRERANVAMGLMVVDSAGLPTVFTSYDANGDGRLTKAELFADVRLDNRPLGKVLTDEQSVDRQRFAQRLGPMSKLAEALMQPRPGTTPAPRAPVQSQPVR
jgi:hypothetical protein